METSLFAVGTGFVKIASYECMLSQAVPNIRSETKSKVITILIL
jgi:hypothetical protein